MQRVHPRIRVRAIYSNTSATRIVHSTRWGVERSSHRLAGLLSPQNRQRGDAARAVLKAEEITP